MAAGAQGIRAGRAYVEIGTHDKLAAGLNRAQRRLKAFGTAVTAIGAKLIKVGALMAAPFALGAKVFGGFDKNMRMVSTMLGDAAGRWMPEFSQAAKDMSKEFGQSTATIAKGMYDLLSAQVAPADMLRVLRDSMKGAIGGITDTAIAVKAVVRIMRGFGLQASQSGDIMDVLAMIVEKGVVTFEELAETIGTVAPTAKAAGMTLSELAATVATLLAVEEPARAMTALRTALFESAEAGMGFMEFVRQFEGADLGKIIEAGIPKKAAQGIVILAQNLELLDKNIAAMGERAGKAEEKYKQMAGGLAHTWGQIKASAAVAFSEVGAAIEEPLMKAAERIKEITGGIAEWVKGNKELVTSILKWTATMIAVGIAMVIVGKGIAIFAGLIAVIKGVVVVVKVLQLAFTVLAANPIGLTLLGIAAFAGLVITAIGALTKRTVELSDAMDKLASAGDELRRTDQLRLERLKQLAEVEKKDAAQKKEAADLIRLLTDRYGDLGISMDQTTGKITGMTAGMLKANKAFREAAILEQSAKIDELLDNYHKLDAEIRDPGWWASRTAASFRAWQASTGAEHRKKMAIIHKRVRAATARIRAMEGGDTGAAFGDETEAERLKRRIAAGKAKGAVPPGTAKARADAGKAIKALAALDEAAAQKHRTALQNELVDIRKNVEERKRLLRVIIAGEMARKGGARPERLQALRLQIGDTEQQGVVARVAAEEKVAEKARKIARDKAASRLSIEKNLQYEIERLEIIRTKKGHDQRMALIGLEERQALEAADAQGLALGLTVRKFGLVKAIAEAAKEVAKVDVGTRGTFSARALWGMGGGKAADRTAKATEEGAKRLKQILTLQQAGGLVFSR